MGVGGGGLTATITRVHRHSTGCSTHPVLQRVPSSPPTLSPHPHAPKLTRRPQGSPFQEQSSGSSNTAQSSKNTRTSTRCSKNTRTIDEPAPGPGRLVRRGPLALRHRAPRERYKMAILPSPITFLGPACHWPASRPCVCYNEIVLWADRDFLTSERF